MNEQGLAATAAMAEPAGTAGTGAIEIVPTGGALGAEIRGLDLSQPLGDAARAIVLEAWYQYHLLVFRGQSLTDPQLVAFSRIFGEPMVDHRPVDYHRHLDTEMPELVDVISNVTVDGKPIGALGAGEAIWHTDTVPVPNAALILHALEVPEAGGETRFCNMTAAYEALSPEMKARIEGLISIHSRTHDLTNAVKAGIAADHDKRLSPGPWFPIVRTHGVTGRRSIFLGQRGSGYVVDLSVEESDALLEELWAHATQPRFVWEHRWRVGDVVVWDNRCTAHSRGAFQPSGRRRLHRTTVRGEWPR